MKGRNGRGLIACAVAAAGCTVVIALPASRRALTSSPPADAAGSPVSRKTTVEASPAPARTDLRVDVRADSERAPSRLALLTARSVATSASIARLDRGAFADTPARVWQARTWPVQGWPLQSLPTQAWPIEGLPTRAWLPPTSPTQNWSTRAWLNLAWSGGTPLSLLPDRFGDGIEDARVNRAPRRSPPLRILQIGDSHTAADFFTGEVRDILQARYGDGSLGVMDVGLPTPGVRSARLKLTASPGWTYQAIQKSSAVEHFALTGFLAETRRAGEVLGFAAEAPVPTTDIELDVQTGPDEGAIEVDLDGNRTRYALKADASRHEVLHLASRGTSPAGLRQLTVRTLDAKHVAVASIAFLNRRNGVSYSNIGFPGATVDILNKFPQQTVIDGLRQLAPAIVVLSFGTNEGFNDKLDLVKYEEQFDHVLATIHAGAPGARIVMIGPSFAERVQAICLKEPQGKACDALRPARPASAAPGPVQIANAQVANAQVAGAQAANPPPDACDWPTPPQLDRVRDLQRSFAAARGIPFWDWSGIMPKRCGAQAWTASEPRLMTADHVHFTKEGYKKSARAFTAFLDPIVRQALGTTHAVSND